MIIIKKNVWSGLLAFIILSGCSDSVEKTNSLDTQDSIESSINIEEEYQKLNDNGKADIVVFKYNEDFMKEKLQPKITEGIVREYSRAVKTLFQRDMNKYYISTHELVDYAILDEILYQSIVKDKNEEIARLKSELESLIDNDEYQKISEMKTYGFEKEDEELNAIVAYADALYALSVGGTVDSLLIFLQVPPSYNGIYSEEIKVLANQSAIPSWEKRYNEYHGLQTQTLSTIPLSIGLTDEEVKSYTSWGEPQTINRTETATTIREQWIYPGFNYLYFEDGYLVSISTSE